MTNYTYYYFPQIYYFTTNHCLFHNRSTDEFTPLWFILHLLVLYIDWDMSPRCHLTWSQRQVELTQVKVSAKIIYPPYHITQIPPVLSPNSPTGHSVQLNTTPQDTSGCKSTKIFNIDRLSFFSTHIYVCMDLLDILHNFHTHTLLCNSMHHPFNVLTTLSQQFSLMEVSISL